MIIDNHGLAYYNSQDLINLLYQNKSTKDLLVDTADSDIGKYLKAQELLDLPEIKPYNPLSISIEEFDQQNQNNWRMPGEYKNMDIDEFLVNQCPAENYQRLVDELQEYRSRNMLDLLRWLQYLVDTCRQHNIVWGVGRGSSVASYTLFLLGVHKIDSVKYNLDWQDFLR
jgi:DNA polymerase III alpha subunit